MLTNILLFFILLGIFACWARLQEIERALKDK